jgi:hypothetical protein
VIGEIGGLGGDEEECKSNDFDSDLGVPTLDGGSESGEESIGAPLDGICASNLIGVISAVATLVI